MKTLSLADVRAEIAKAKSADKAMSSICLLIRDRVPHCDWVGFYLVDADKKDELVLGPFIGEPTEHVRIRFGRGVCGSAAEAKCTIVVDDVSRESNYLSCSPKVRSEIVVPIIRDGEVKGELDIDSHTPAAFGKKERELFEQICRIVSTLF